MLDRLLPILESLPGLAFVYLFGSRAVGRARPDSDVDLALMLDGELASMSPYERISLLAPRLTPVTGLGLDLVFLDQAGPLLAHRILRDGLLIHERDRAARVRFYARTVGIYLDTQPMREFHARETRLRALEGRIGGRSRDPREAPARPGGARS